MQSEPGFLEYLLNGRYLPVIGIALITIVSLARTGLAMRWPWFKTKLGGYVLGFGSAAVLYIGEGLRSGAGVDLGLVTGALGMGWAASGGWEMIRDLIIAWRAPSSKAEVPKMTVVSLALVVALLGCSSCKDLPPPEAIAKAVVDCTRADQGQVNAVLREMLPLVYGDTPNWKSVEERAISAGVTIGGCALAELVQLYLGGRKAPLQSEGWNAHETLERFRHDVAGDATFRTAKGDL